MKKKLFLATHNEGKIQRFKNLLEQTGLDVEIHIPEDFGLGDIEAEENGKTLAENRMRKPLTKSIKKLVYIWKMNSGTQTPQFER